jgi:hypothetical protein
MGPTLGSHGGTAYPIGGDMLTMPGLNANSGAMQIASIPEARLSACRDFG